MWLRKDGKPCRKPDMCESGQPPPQCLASPHRDNVHDPDTSTSFLYPNFLSCGDDGTVFKTTMSFGFTVVAIIAIAGAHDLVDA
jgi:hypothetical protein